MGVRTRELSVLGHRLVVSGDEHDAYLRDIQDEVDDDVLHLLGRLLPSDAVVADVGANLGIHTLAAARLAPDGHVHAFEPVPATAGHLASNVRANGTSNVTCHEIALAAEGGKLTLFENTEFTAGSTVLDYATPLSRGLMSGAADPTPGFDKLVSVRSTTLDAVVEDQHIDRLDLLKIDTEGFDLDVLRGATRALATLRPVVIMEFASFALTTHRQLFPADALAELRSSFDRIFVVLRNGALREIVSDYEAWSLLYENATVRPVQDLLGAFTGSRLIGRVEKLASEDGDEERPPQTVGELRRALEDERSRAAEMAARLAASEESLSAARQTLQDSHRRSASLAAELDAVRRTLSWRVTRPLRALRRLGPRKP